jgi:hypothetical protein
VLLHHAQYLSTPFNNAALRSQHQFNLCDKIEQMLKGYYDDGVHPLIEQLCAKNKVKGDVHSISLIGFPNELQAHNTWRPSTNLFASEVISTCVGLLTKDGAIVNFLTTNDKTRWDQRYGVKQKNQQDGFKRKKIATILLSAFQQMSSKVHKIDSLFLQCSQEHFDLPSFYGTMGFDELPYEEWPDNLQQQFEPFLDTDCMQMVFEKAIAIKEILQDQLTNNTTRQYVPFEKENDFLCGICNKETEDNLVVCRLQDCENRFHDACRDKYLQDKNTDFKGFPHLNFPRFTSVCARHVQSDLDGIVVKCFYEECPFLATSGVPTFTCYKDGCDIQFHTVCQRRYLTAMKKYSKAKTGTGNVLKLCPKHILEHLKERLPEFMKKRQADKAAAAKRPKKKNAMPLHHQYHSCSYALCYNKESCQDNIAVADMFTCIVEGCFQQFHRFCLRYFLHQEALLGFYQRHKMKHMCEKHLLEQIDKVSKNEGTCCYEETSKCNLSRGQHDEMVECDHCEDEDQTTYHYMCFVDHIYQQHGYNFDDWDKYRSRCLQCWNKLLITQNIPVLQDGNIAVCQHQCTYGSCLYCVEDGHRLYYQTAVQCYNTTCLNQVHPECYIKYMQDWWVKRDQSAFDKDRPYCVDCATTKAREADKTNLPVCAYNNVYHCCDEGQALSEALCTVCNRTKSCKVRVHMECFLNYVDQYYDDDFPNDKAMCMKCVLYHAKKKQA